MKERYSAADANEIAVNAAIDSATSNAKMGEQITYLVKGFDILNMKVDSFSNAYVSVRDFTQIEDRVKQAENKVETMQKYLWLGVGGLTVITFFLKFFVK